MVRESPVRMEPTCENETPTLQPWTTVEKAVMSRASVHASQHRNRPFVGGRLGWGRQGSAVVLTGAESPPRAEVLVRTEGKKSGFKEGRAESSRQLVPALSLSVS